MELFRLLNSTLQIVLNSLLVLWSISVPKRNFCICFPCDPIILLIYLNTFLVKIWTGFLEIVIFIPYISVNVWWYISQVCVYYDEDSVFKMLHKQRYFILFLCKQHRLNLCGQQQFVGEVCGLTAIHRQ